MLSIVDVGGTVYRGSSAGRDAEGYADPMIPRTGLLTGIDAIAGARRTPAVIIISISAECR